MPRRWRSSAEAVSKPSGRGTWRRLLCASPRFDYERRQSADRWPILAVRRRPIGNVCGANLTARRPGSQRGGGSPSSFG
jgi:hypothetical protein